MLTYIARRLVTALPTLLGVSLVVFLMVRLLPGDPARTIAGMQASAEDVEVIRERLGLNEPAPVQYGLFLARLARLDLGTSARTGQPVAREVFARLPHTLQLAASSVALASVVGIAAGVLAATHHNRWQDTLVSALVLFGVSVPVYALGVLLIVVFAINLHWLPAAGSEDPGAWILPTLSLAAFSVALIARMTRASLLEVLHANYLRTARGKGLDERSVILGHALRNALLPVVTVIGLQFGTLLGGAVLTEAVFGWPGLGQLLVDALFSRDYPLVQGIILTFSTLFILLSLAMDVVYAYLEPRIRYG